MGLFKKRDVVQTSIASRLHDHMGAIRAMFPGNTKLTLVIRAETLREPVIMTNDTAEETIKAIRQMTPGKPGLVITH